MKPCGLTLHQHRLQPGPRHTGTAIIIRPRYTCRMHLCQQRHRRTAGSPTKVPFYVMRDVQCSRLRVPGSYRDFVSSCDRLRNWKEGLGNFKRLTPDAAVACTRLRNTGREFRVD